MEIEWLEFKYWFYYVVDKWFYINFLVYEVFFFYLWDGVEGGIGFIEVS